MDTNRLDACLDFPADTHRRQVIHQLRHAERQEATIGDLVDTSHATDDVSAHYRC